jgi:hypothetical protein
MRRVYRGFRDRSLSVWLAWALGGGKLPDRTKLKQRKFVRPEDPPDDGGRRHLTSPRRALVFVLLGPVLGPLAIWSAATVMTGQHVELDGIPAAWVISVIACVITRPVDGVLARDTPIWLTAPLTAAVGAVVAVGIFLLLGALLFGSKVLSGPWPLLILVAIVGAAATGISSLLSHNYCGGRQ